MRNYPAVGVSLLPYSQPNSASYAAAMVKSYFAEAFVSDDGTFPTTFFYDISNRVQNLSIKRGRNYELGRAESGELTLEVANWDGLLTPTNTNSPLYGSLMSYRPIMVTAAYGSSAAPTVGNIVSDVNANIYPLTNTLLDSNNQVAEVVSVADIDSTFEGNAVNSNWYYVVGSVKASVAFSSAQAWQGTQSLQILTPPVNRHYVLDVPVVPNQTYTASIYLYVNAGQTLTLQVYDGVFVSSNTPADTATATGAAWTRYDVTWTATAPRAAIIVYAASGNGGFADGLQVELGSSATTYTNTGLTVRQLFTGFVERYPQNWYAPNQPVSTLLATDALANAARITLGSLYESNTLLLNPFYYYPLDSEADAVLASNNSPYNQNPLQWKDFNYLAAGTSGTGVFGDELAQQIISAGTTGARTTWGTDDTAPYKALSVSPTPELSLSETVKSFSFEIWFYPTEGNGTTHLGNAPFAAYATEGGTAACFQAYNEYSAIADQIDIILGDNVRLTNTHNIIYNTWNYLVAFFSVDTATGSSTLKTFVGNDFGSSGVTTTSGTTDFNQISEIRLGELSEMSFAHFAIYADDITGQGADRLLLGLSGQYGDSVSNQFETVLENSGVKYPLISVEDSVSFGTAIYWLDGKSLFDAEQTLVDTEMSTWGVAGNGTIFMRNRRYRQLQFTPKYEFSDDSSFYPYNAAEVKVNYDPTFILNDIKIQRANGILATAFNSQSVADYFPRSYERTLYNLSDLEAIDAAYYLLDRYKDPAVRVEQITLTPSSVVATWIPALNVELDDLIYVNKTQTLAGTYGFDIEGYYFVERIEHELNGQEGTWTTRFALSPQLKTYNELAALEAVLTADYTSASSNLQVTAVTDFIASDLVVGQKLQIENTTVLLGINGVSTQVGSTITIPVARILEQTTIADEYVSPSATLINLTSTFGSGSYTLLVGTEYIAGSLSGTIFTVTQRGDLGSQPQPLYGGQPVWQVVPVTGPLPTQPTGSTVLEYTENTEPFYNNETGSYSLQINAPRTTTTPASGLAYTKLTFNQNVDYANVPAANYTSGQLVISEYFNALAAFVNVSEPTATGVWSAYFYPVDGYRLLATDLSQDSTTVTTTVAVPAGTRAILIDNEWCEVTAGAGTTTLTVVRGTPDDSVWGVLTQGEHLSRQQTTKVYYVTTLTGLGTAFANGSSVYVDNLVQSAQIQLAY